LKNLQCGVLKLEIQSLEGGMLLTLECMTALA
jgi:hypothetical protein